MKTGRKIIITVCVAVLAVLLSIGLGSVRVPILDIVRVIGYRAFGFALPEHITASSVSIVWNLRLPRVLLAFAAGAALSTSGAVMQSVLRNPLASSYTLGVSSGASLGASLVIFMGITLPVVTMFSLPLIGFGFGFLTILLVMGIASRLDGRMETHTIILTGVVFSLFVNAITTLLFALFRENIQRMLFWQMGSFSTRGWYAVFILLPLVVLGILFISRFKWELDIMTFGEEQAQVVGVNIRRVKWILLVVSSALTGATVAFVGVIGFVDLVTPHIVRKLFGSRHRYLIPMSAVVGGAFMAICDLVARTVVSPIELPVGTVTAILGAPFFAYIYFSKRKRV